MRWSGYEMVAKMVWLTAGYDDGLAMLCWKGNSLTSGNCTLRDGKEAIWANG
jgi:hypothetical protein